MPLVNNRFMLYDMAKVWGITGLFMVALFGVSCFIRATCGPCSPPCRLSAW